MWQTYNPSFEFEYFCEEQMTEWVKYNTSSRLLDCFNSLNTGAGRADFYRIRKLFVEGGIWFDADLPANDILKKFPNLIDTVNCHKTVFFLTKKTNEPRFMIMASQKGNPIFSDFQEQVCRELIECKNSKDFVATINLTGPKAFHKCLCKYLKCEKISDVKIGSYFSEKDISFIFLEDIVGYSEKGGAEIMYKGYRDELGLIGVTHHKFENAYK